MRRFSILLDKPGLLAQFESLKLAFLPPWQGACLVLGLFCAGVFLLEPDEQVVMSSEFLYQFFVLDRPVSLLALALTLVAMVGVDRSGRMQACLRWVSAYPGWLAGIVLAASALGAWFAYRQQPLSMDEYSAWLQSQIFAAGHLTGQLPPALMDRLVVVGFQGHFIQVSHATGAIAAIYWPGLPLVMAPFSLVGVPWLCNPVITALTFVGLARLLEAFVKDPAARGFGLLAALASPVILISGMSYYGMPLQLLCSVMFTLGVIRGSPRHLLAAGAWASLGMTTVNPVPLILYALPWLVWLLLREAAPWHRLGWLALGGLPLSLLLGLGWRLLVLNGIQDGGTAGSGASLASLLQVFQPPTAELFGIRVLSLIKVCLWAIPGLPVLAGLAYAKREKGDGATLFAASAVIMIVGYLFVPFDQGNGWGYRYFHAAWLTLPVLAAVAIQQLAADPAQRQRAYGFAFMACIGTLAVALPWRIGQVESFVGTSLRQIPERVEGNSRQAVFVDVRCGFHTYDRIQNDPFLRGNEIRLVSKGEASDAEIAARLGPNPRPVVRGTCGQRWLLD